VNVSGHEGHPDCNASEAPCCRSWTDVGRTAQGLLTQAPTPMDRSSGTPLVPPPKGTPRVRTRSPLPRRSCLLRRLHHDHRARAGRHDRRAGLPGQAHRPAVRPLAGPRRVRARSRRGPRAESLDLDARRRGRRRRGQRALSGRSRDRSHVAEPAGRELGHDGSDVHRHRAQDDALLRQGEHVLGFAAGRGPPRRSPRPHPRRLDRHHPGRHQLGADRRAADDRHKLAPQQGNAIQVAFRFTPRGSASWTIDDVYVDPYRSR